MKKKSLITVFTDCCGSNATSRQTKQWKKLFPNADVRIHQISHPVQGAGCIMDLLDKDFPQIIVAQAAPREEKIYENGAPFSYVQIGETLIIGTLDVFFLLKRFGVAKDIFQTDVFEVCKKFLNEDEACSIAKSQFRSLNFVPLLAKWICEGKNIPHTLEPIQDVERQYVWYVDEFEKYGNCKTTATKVSELSQFSMLPFYERLSLAPKGKKPVIIIGSSGYGDQNFIEIVIQGGNASKYLNLSVGDIV